MATIRCIIADITLLDVDAIVNAANERMLGGGGVDGAIHQAAGPNLHKECQQLPQVRPGIRCLTGNAVMTAGYDLPAKYIIHTVGPVWSGGNGNEDQLLASCYRESLRLAATRSDIRTIAFPAISTGVFGFPARRAAGIAVRTIEETSAALPTITEVIACCFDAWSAQHYQELLSRS